MKALVLSIVLAPFNSGFVDGSGLLSRVPALAKTRQGRQGTSRPTENEPSVWVRLAEISEVDGTQEFDCEAVGDV